MSVDRWELANWDAVETAERIARKDVSALEVIDAAIARSEDRKALNAIVTPTTEHARAAAPTASGPLAGVPTFIKDLVPVKGVRIGWGSGASGHLIAKRSDPLVGQLARTGLVSLGKSATPEIGLTATTEPLAFGPTHNPWNPEHSTGGSSGGAAALVSSGVVPIAHASDGGGSIRIPASCCGLVGLKPTRARLDMAGSNLLIVNIAVNGVVTRTVRDTVAFWSAMGAQGIGRKLPPVGVAKTKPAKRLKVLAYLDPPNHVPVDDEVKATFAQAVKTMRELGHEVREEACPIPAQAFDDFISLWLFVGWIQVATSRFTMGVPFKLDQVEPLTRGFVEKFGTARLKWIREAIRLRQWTHDYEKPFEQVDVLMCPTLAKVPPKLGWLSPAEPFETSYQRLVSYTPYTGTYNASGAPAISLPYGTSTSGLPIGVHFAAKNGQEALLLEIAAELEAAHPWNKIAPRSVEVREKQPA